MKASLKKITSYEVALSIIELSEKEIRSNEAFIKLTAIAKALNEGWIPDWSDWSQRKYYIYSRYLYSVVFGGIADTGAFAGFGDSFTYCAPSYANAYFGARLCFKSADLADFVIETFPELLKDLCMVDQ